MRGHWLRLWRLILCSVRSMNKGLAMAEFRVTPSRWWRRALRSRALQALLLLCIVAVLLARWVGTQEGLTELREQLGPVAPAITVPVHAVIAISPLPSEVVAFANGLMYGFWGGAALSWLGWMLAALVHYAAARRAAADMDIDALLQRAPRWLQRFPAEHPVFLIAGRWIPYGPQLVCTIAGAYGVRLLRFAACTAVSIVPVALFFAALATRLG